MQDQELFAALNGNDKRQKNLAWEAIQHYMHEGYFPWIYHCVGINEKDERSRLTAEDAFREAIKVFLENMGKGKFIPRNAAIKSYIFTVARNIIINYLRKQQTVSKSYSGFLKETTRLSENENTAFYQQELEEARDRIHSAIKELDLNCQQWIRLKYLDNKSTGEMLSVKAISKDSLHVALTRCRNKLFIIFKNKFGFPNTGLWT